MTFRPSTDGDDEVNMYNNSIVSHVTITPAAPSDAQTIPALQ